MVNTRGSIDCDGPAGSLQTVKGDKVPVVHVKNMLGKAGWVCPASGKDKPLCGTFFAKRPGYAEKQACSVCTMREFDVGESSQ